VAEGGSRDTRCWNAYLIDVPGVRNTTTSGSQDHQYLRATKNPFGSPKGFFVNQHVKSRDYASSIAARWARRMALASFILFFTDGLVKYDRFLTSLRIPDRSYFFLNRRIALSIGSFSPMIIPTKKIHLLRGVDQFKKLFVDSILP
jgi:hypothetical protein